VIDYSFHAGETMREVAEHLRSIGEPLPNLLLSVGWLAKNDSGKIVGCIVIQSVPLCEPCKGENGDIVKALFAMAEDWIKESRAPRIFAHSNHPAMKLHLKRKGAVPSSDEWFEWNPQGVS
jgi:hypothetical protein